VTAVSLAVFVAVADLRVPRADSEYLYSELLHWRFIYGPDGRYGQFLTYLLVLLPMGWLIFAGLFGHKKPGAPAHQTASR
jgi:hypothetical protein